MSRPQFQLGGQALIEGVMMRGPTHVGAAVRRSDGSIQTRVEPFASVLKKHPYLNIPLVRGVIALFEMLGLGMGYLNWSSNLVLADEKAAKKAPADEVDAVITEPLTGAPVAIEKEIVEQDGSTKPSLPIWMFLLTVVGSLGLGMGLFIALPNLITDWVVRPLTPNRVVLNIAEGLIKLAIFIAYVYFIGRRKHIQRVFQYHGAEHKVVYAAENGRPLTPEGARPFDTPHPRCGTGFALVTVFVSILCFAFLPWTENHALRVGLRLALMPLVAGISYEIIKATVSPRFSSLAIFVVRPGMWLQRLTTSEPDDEQLEVACEAMRVLIAREEEVRQAVGEEKSVAPIAEPVAVKAPVA